MKILSIRQPWAWAIINAGKDVENRSWPTKVRGRVLVHAGVYVPDENDAEDMLDASGLGMVERAALAGRAFKSGLLKERGGIVGSVEIVDCVTDYPSPWFFGPYGFVLRDPRPLPFTPLRGRLGFFDAPPEVMDQLRGDNP